MANIFRLLSIALFAATLWGQAVYTIAGLPPFHRSNLNGKSALQANLNFTYGLLIDRQTGRILLHDESVVWRLEPDGTLFALAGLGTANEGATTDGTPASFFRFGILRGMAQDKQGVLYLAGAGSNAIYQLLPDGTVRTFAGGGTSFDPNYRGPASGAFIGSPRGMVFDSKGNLNYADVFCRCIRQLSPDGSIAPLYRLPQRSGFSQYFEGLAIDAQDNLYATEFRGSMVLKIAPDGTAVTLAGTDDPGYSGDGGPASAAQLNGPSGVALDKAGNIFIADTGNHRIRKITADGKIQTIAGTGVCSASGDGGPALAATICAPAQIVFDAAGNLYFSDYINAKVRKITPDGIMQTIAGSGRRDLLPSNVGDGGPAIRASFGSVSGLAFDSSGATYVSDAGNFRIRRITADGIIQTIAGNGQFGDTGDGGPALDARLIPGPLAFDPAGSLYVIASTNKIRKITPDGRILPFAGKGFGTGPIRSQGDGGPATEATLNEPGAVAFDAKGNTYIADSSSARIRKVDTSGTISTFGPTGTPGMDYYNFVVVTPDGTLYLGWTHVTPSIGSSAYIVKVGTDGSFTTVAGNGKVCGFTPKTEYPDGPALNAPLCAIFGMRSDAAGNLFITDGSYGGVILKFAAGNLTRVAGSAVAIDSYEGDPVLSTSLGANGAVAFDGAGNMIFARRDFTGSRIRAVLPQAALKLSTNRVDFQGRQSRFVTIASTVAEPLPYLIRITAPWITSTRLNGLTGESFTLTTDPTGLASGVYTTTVQVSLVTRSLTAAPTDPGRWTIEVTLTVP